MKSAGLLELLLKAPPSVAAPAKGGSAGASLKMQDVVIFYSLLYAAGLGIFLCMRFLEPIKINASKILRQIAVIYWRWSRLAPMVASVCLFLVADLLAQAAGNKTHPNESEWKIALFLSSGIYNAIWHNWFYAWLDRTIEQGEGVGGRTKQAVKMIAIYLLIYLPIGVPLFLIMSDFLDRTFADAANNCATSALVAIPQHIGDSTALAAAQLAPSYGWSFIFWPAGSIINFTLIHTWSPGFKSTWDAILTILWNSYILVMQSVRGSSDPVAIGPIIADRGAVIPDLQKQAPSMDCKKTSATSVATASTYFIVETIWTLTVKMYQLTEWTLLHSKTAAYDFGCLCSRYSWNSWCVICFLVRTVYMLAWLAASWSCTIVWRVIMIPFQLFDKFKWFIGLFFFPRMWDYDACPCPEAKFDDSWWKAGVIYEGSLFYAK